MDVQEDQARWREFADRFEQVESSVQRVIRGKDAEIRLALVTLFAEGHLLIEDVPGVGKTLLAKAIARSIDCSFRRIQFTPDLLPTDVTGVNVFNQDRGDFEFRPGAIFANVVLGDEINRGSPKTQSALLECMEERQVTIDGATHALGTPFLVIATQNPVEYEGTYPLPEAQLDRFLVRLSMGYPSADAEMEILEGRGSAGSLDDLTPVTDAPTVASMIAQTHEVYASPAVQRYIVDISAATRDHPDVFLGASPRASVLLLRAARSLAAAEAREFVTPDDVKGLAQAVLSHRIIATADAAMGGRGATEVVADVVSSIHVPVADPH